MTSDQMKKLVLDRANEINQLLIYLRQHEDEKPGVSKQDIARYMLDKGLASRITTLNLINYLLQEGMLIDNKTMNYQSNLSINQQYDFDNLLSEILSSELQEMGKKFKPLAQFADLTPKMDKMLKLELKHLIGVSESWRYIRDKKEYKKVKATHKVNNV